MHKHRGSPNTPLLAPNVSSIETFNNKLAKYFGIILSPHTQNKYCVSDSFSSVKEIKYLFSCQKFLVYYDHTAHSSTSRRM